MADSHPAFVQGAVAVITGGASGIGLAAAKKLAGLGLRVCIADLGADRLEKAREAIAAVAANADDVMVSETDVSQRDAIVALEEAVHKRFGGTDVLMNNAGIGPQTSTSSLDNWERLLAVNLWGIIHGTQVFLPNMIERTRNGRKGAIINTGSKQGITTPPGNPAYNVSKAGVKAFTEALQHDLRNMKDCTLSAHLLIPGFVWTEMATRGKAVDEVAKAPGAWTSEQTVDFMMECLGAGDFYILCPDNDVPRAVDERRILWAAQDLIENRPPLSRWHPDFADAFAAFLAKK